jgi:hypothetical protein
VHQKIEIMTHKLRNNKHPIMWIKVNRQSSSVKDKDEENDAPFLPVHRPAALTITTAVIVSVHLSNAQRGWKCFLFFV